MEQWCADVPCACNYEVKIADDACVMLPLCASRNVILVLCAGIDQWPIGAVPGVLTNVQILLDQVISMYKSNDDVILRTTYSLFGIDNADG
jgi:hypothetical protein